MIFKLVQRDSQFSLNGRILTDDQFFTTYEILRYARVLLQSKNTSRYKYVFTLGEPHQAKLKTVLSLT